MPKLSAWMVYGGVFAAIIAVIALGYQAPQQTATEAVANATQTPTAEPLVVEGDAVDKLVATGIAFNIAEQTDMSIANNIGERAVTLAIESELAQTDDTAIIKPQIVQPTASSREVVTYKVKKGDTMNSIANAYGVSTKTIRWANDKSNNTISAGDTLKIPPVDGVLYKVKSSDTLDKLASTYGANKARIISFNDLELSGLKAGSKIIIPGGSLPTNQQPGYTAAPVQQISFYSSRGSGYAYGYCTYYAAARRAEIGKPIPGSWGNATSWAWFAAQDRFGVGSVPRVGAIMQSSGGYGGLGHVAIVEEVKANGDIVISEMNGYRFGGGWGIVGRGTIPKSQTFGFRYIY